MTHQNLIIHRIRSREQEPCMHAGLSPASMEESLFCVQWAPATTASRPSVPEISIQCCSIRKVKRCTLVVCVKLPVCKRSDSAQMETFQ